MAAQTEYLGRGIHKKNFEQSLLTGKLSQMLNVINDDNQLDFQIRNNYLNIYYKGGNIAKVTSENSVSFNEFYFYLNMKEVPKKEIENNILICNDLKDKRDVLIEKFKQGSYIEYFAEAKKAMDEWLNRNSKQERMEQHNLSIENQYKKSDYTIIDLEYEVSINSEFHCTYIPLSKDKPKKPRFDIIAVNNSGKLCIIEFKKGKGALIGTSGLREHWDCYQQSIGRKTQPFMEEMKKLLEQKQKLNLIDKEVKILNPIPEFMFAYSYDEKNTPKEQDEAFEDEYKKIGAQIKVLKLKKGIYKLEDK